MSTTNTAPISAAADSADSSGRFSLRRVGDVGGPVVLVAGAVLAATGMGLHMSAMTEDVTLAVAIAEDPRWLTAHLLLGFGFALVAIGAASAVPLIRGRGATVTTSGAIATSAGALLMSLGDIAHGAVGFALGDHVDAATSFAIHMAYFEHPAILGLNMGPMVITVGMILLGAGVLRSHAVPRWMGVVVAVAPIAVHAALNLQVPTYLHGVPMVIGLSVFAYALVASAQRRDAVTAAVAEVRQATRSAA